MFCCGYKNNAILLKQNILIAILASEVQLKIFLYKILVFFIHLKYFLVLFTEMF